MKLLELFVNVVTILVFSVVKRTAVSAVDQVYVCACEDPLFLGAYSTSGETMDDAPIYTNANDLSIFRHNKFWYIGNLAPWPPETHFRCVEAEDCGFDELVPPVTTGENWKGSKRFKKEGTPTVSFEPCAATDEL